MRFLKRGQHSVTPSHQLGDQRFLIVWPLERLLLNKKCKISINTGFEPESRSHGFCIFECLSDPLKASQLAGLQVHVHAGYLIDTQTVGRKQLTHIHTKLRLNTCYSTKTITSVYTDCQQFSLFNRRLSTSIKH